MNEVKPTPNPTKASNGNAEDALAPKHAKVEDAQAKRKKRTVVALSVALALLLCGGIAGGGYVWWQKQQLEKAAAEAKEAPVPEAEPAPEPTVEEPDPRVENPIDFASLQQENIDIYAWIYVPNTNVNYPVLQSSTNDYYYLNHDRYGSESIAGAIYSEMANSIAFSDPVTLLYGHNNGDDAMFATLHYFEDPTFFAENDTFYIYTPEHILTYKIVSAYISDDRHILNSSNMLDESERQAYFSYVQNPDSLVVNVRDGASIAIDDKLVQLSTCMTDLAQSNRRYLVSGVLVDDQPTY